LVAALDGALALRKVEHVAVRVGDDLNLDVSRLVDKLLNEDPIVTKGGGGLGLGEPEGF
jgi:hypothetical protein